MSVNKCHTSSCYIGYRILLSLMHVCYPKIHFPPFMRDIQASISQVFINYSVYISIILMRETFFWSNTLESMNLKSLFSVVCFYKIIYKFWFLFHMFRETVPYISWKNKDWNLLCHLLFSMGRFFSFSFNFIHW